MDIAEGQDVRAALPTRNGPMRAMNLLWKEALPGSDIAVFRVQVPGNSCFRTRFAVPLMGQDVETAAIPESMLIRDASDNTAMFASFALPKGMSGAPMIVTDANKQYVEGVFVGQSRGEEIEDEIVEVADTSPDGTHRHTERVSRVEYFARGDLLLPYQDFIAPKFDGLTLGALIAKELPKPVQK
jgi:hypothetical protein